MPDIKILDDIVAEFNLKDDEELKKEKELEETEEEEELEEEEVLEDDDLEEDDEEELEEDEEEEEIEIEVTKQNKPTKEDKEKYAFEQLRKKAKESEDYQKKLDEIAHEYGFASNKEMIEKLEKDAMLKKAKEQGVDPKFYEDLQNTKKQLEALKREREAEVEVNRINKFIERVDAFAKDNNLNDTEKSELIENLDADGFTIETLSNIKNYKALFAGYMSEKIIEKAKQKDLAKAEKRKKLRENPLETSQGNNDKFDLNKALEELFKNRHL